MKKITELYYTLRNHLSKEEKAEVKFMLSIFKDKRTHRPYITGSEKVRNVAYELGYQVTTSDILKSIRIQYFKRGKRED